MMLRPLHASGIKYRILNVSVWLLFAVFANIFAVWFVSKEQYIYYWDFAEYWHDTTLMVYMLQRAPLGAVSKLLYSIRHDDYNYLPAFPLTLPMVIFGRTRLVYILSVVNVYAIPAAFVTTAATRAIARGAGFPPAESLCFVVPAVLLTLPVFWVPMLRGYPDVGGLIFVSSILFFYFRQRPQTLKTGTLIVCGVLLAFLLLFRRWYGFWVLSFILLLPLDAAFELWSQRRFDLDTCWKAYRPAILIVFSFGIALTSIAWPLIVRMIATPYRDIYSAYRANTGLLEASRDAGRFYLGTFVCSAFAIAVIVLAASRILRRICVFHFSQLILITVLFERVQAFGWQHLYLLIPAIVICLSLALVMIAKMTIWLIVPMYSFVSIMAFLPVFLTYQGPLSHFSQAIASTGRCYPLIRHDLPEIRRLLAVLQDYDSRTGGTVYVLASSPVINSSLLWDANQSLGTNFKVTGRIVRSAEVDKRDGFPMRLLDAEYVLVAVPIQYHLRPEDQRVIGIPAQALLMHINIGNAFDQLPESFTLSGGVKIYIFRKTRPITPEGLSQLESACERVYPTRPDICFPARR
jgi:hypothetical protein